MIEWSSTGLLGAIKSVDPKKLTIETQSESLAVDAACVIPAQRAGTIASAMPKSAFSANSQAKVAASAIRAELTDATASPAACSNTCWSLISAENSVIEAVTKFMSQTGEDSATWKTNFEDSGKWYAEIAADMFG